MHAGRTTMMMMMMMSRGRRITRIHWGSQHLIPARVHQHFIIRRCSRVWFAMICLNIFKAHSRCCACGQSLGEEPVVARLVLFIYAFYCFLMFIFLWLQHATSSIMHSHSIRLQEQGDDSPSCLCCTFCGALHTTHRGCGGQGVVKCIGHPSLSSHPTGISDMRGLLWFPRHNPKMVGWLCIVFLKLCLNAFFVAVRRLLISTSMG